MPAVLCVQLGISFTLTWLNYFLSQSLVLDSIRSLYWFLYNTLLTYDAIKLIFLNRGIQFDDLNLKVSQITIYSYKLFMVYFQITLLIFLGIIFLFPPHSFAVNTCVCLCVCVRAHVHMCTFTCIHEHTNLWISVDSTETWIHPPLNHCWPLATAYTSLFWTKSQKGFAASFILWLRKNDWPKVTQMVSCLKQD